MLAEALDTKKIKKQLMGLETSLIPKLVGVAVEKITYKDGVQFYLRHDNDFQFEIKCTVNEKLNTIDCVITLVYKDFPVLLGLRGDTINEVENEILNAMSVLVRTNCSEDELLLDLRKVYLKSFKQSIIDSMRITGRSVELLELSKRFEQIKLF